MLIQYGLGTCHISTGVRSWCVLLFVFAPLGQCGSILSPVVAITSGGIMESPLDIAGGECGLVLLSAAQNIAFVFGGGSKDGILIGGGG